MSDEKAKRHLLKELSRFVKMQSRLGGLPAVEKFEQAARKDAHFDGGEMDRARRVAILNHVARCHSLIAQIMRELIESEGRSYDKAKEREAETLWRKIQSLRSIVSGGAAVIAARRKGGVRRGEQRKIERAKSLDVDGGRENVARIIERLSRERDAKPAELWLELFGELKSLGLRPQFKDEDGKNPRITYRDGTAKEIKFSSFKAMLRRARHK